MSANCPYCGATLNFGLKFCVVCGRQSAATNKMGGTVLKTGARQADMTRRIDEEFMAAQVRSKRKALRFRKSIRTLGQTIFYGFIAGTLFFCAVRFALESVFPGSIKRVVVPLVEPFLHNPDETAAIDSKGVDDTGADAPKPTKAKKSKKGHNQHRRKIANQAG